MRTAMDREKIAPTPLPDPVAGIVESIRNLVAQGKMPPFVIGVLSEAADLIQSLSQSLASTDAEIERLRAIETLFNGGIRFNAAKARGEAAKLIAKERIRAEAAEARIAEMEKALEPFAKEADTFSEAWPDAHPVCLQQGKGLSSDLSTNCTVGDLRRARLARQGAK